jgi:hypothetical protein
VTEPARPAWLPDPSGRHELRWFDGTSFTDQVADAGVRSTDAGGSPPPPPPPASFEPAPPASFADNRLPIEVTKRPSRVPIILGVVGVLLVVVALVALVAGGGGSGGQGTFDGEVVDGEESSHTVSVGGGSVLVVQLRPSDDLDAVVELDLQGDERRAVVDQYDDLPGVLDVLLRRDLGFEGEEEQTFLAVPVDVDVDVVVSGFEGGEGDYEITIDVIDLDVDDDADVEDLLSAATESDDVPRSIQDEIEDVLAGLG